MTISWKRSRTKNSSFQVRISTSTLNTVSPHLSVFLNHKLTTKWRQASRSMLRYWAFGRFNISHGLTSVSCWLFVCCSALASAEPIAQVGVDFGTPTGTFQLGDSNTIPNTFQTGDANTLPAIFGVGGGSAPTFTLGDGSNTIPATFSTGDSPFSTGSPGFSTEEPFVPGGTFSTGDGLPAFTSAPLNTPAPVDYPSPAPELEPEEAEVEQPAQPTSSKSCFLEIFCFWWTEMSWSSWWRITDVWIRIGIQTSKL